MLIHLGKVYLGQTDKVEISVKPQAVYFERSHNPRDAERAISMNGQDALPDTERASLECT
jgi:hypothetical protein